MYPESLNLPLTAGEKELCVKIIELGESFAFLTNKGELNLVEIGMKTAELSFFLFSFFFSPRSRLSGYYLFYEMIALYFHSNFPVHDFNRLEK